MKTKIIELLNTKNDKKENIFNFSPSIVPTTPWKYSSNENMRYYLWLCQIQKWLRDEYEHFIFVIPHISYLDKTMEWTNNLSIREDVSFISFEQALESGIYKILTNLIKSNGKNNQ